MNCAISTEPARIARRIPAANARSRASGARIGEKSGLDSAGFSLVEVLIALAITVAAVIIIGTGLIRSLETDRVAVERARGAAMLRTIECAARLPALKAELLNPQERNSIIAERRIEFADREWAVWEFAPGGDSSARFSLQFIDPD